MGTYADPYKAKTPEQLRAQIAKTNPGETIFFYTETGDLHQYTIP